MSTDTPRRARFPGGASRPIVSPIQTSVVYAADDPDALDSIYEGRVSGFTYAREGHPNASVLGGLIDKMEGASGGVVLSSGMAAVTVALLASLKSGDHAIGADQLYGRSLRLMREELPRLGIGVTLADATDAATIEAAIRPETRMILVETLSNPTLRIADLEGIVALGRHCGIPVAVDNTFATPRALNPLALGADMVIHSVTKLLAGHSDATLGYVAAASSELNHRLSALSATLGTTPAPFDCWLAERGLYTFGLRYDRASATAARLAEALADAGLRVFYPTRDDHPDRDRATTLLGGQGGHMVSFDLGGGREEANRFARTLDEVAFAPTLGDIATTLSHPASSSHRGLTPEARHALGISEGFFRISVGCEDPDDLTRAFLAALA